MLCVGMCIDKMRCFSCPPISAFTFTTKHADQNTESPVSNVNGNELNSAGQSIPNGLSLVILVYLDYYILIFEIFLTCMTLFFAYMVCRHQSAILCAVKKTRQNRHRAHLRLHCCKLLLSCKFRSHIFA